MNQLRAAVEKKIDTFPEDERPVAFWLDYREIAKIQKSYGIDVFAMSRKSFRDFALAAAAGQHDIKSLDAPSNYMAATFFYAFQENSNVLNALTVRVLTDLHAAYTPPENSDHRFSTLTELVDRWQLISWNEAALNYVPNLTDAHLAADLLFARATEAFDDAHAAAFAYDSLRMPLLNALRACLYKCGEWSQPETGYHTAPTYVRRIPDKQLLLEYEQALPPLLDHIERLDWFERLGMNRPEPFFDSGPSQASNFIATFRHMLQALQEARKRGV